MNLPLLTLNIPGHSISWPLLLVYSASAVCLIWTITHRPKRTALGPKPDKRAKLREFIVFDIRAVSGYCTWYVTALGVIVTIILSNRQDFSVILNRAHLWPFGVSLAAAGLATLFIPAGYGEESFQTLRGVWMRSILCGQTVVIFTSYGVWNILVTVCEQPPRLAGWVPY